MYFEASPIPSRPFFLVCSKCSIWFVIVPSIPHTLVHSCRYFFHSCSLMFTLVHITVLYIVFHSSYLLFTLGQSYSLLFTLVHCVLSPDLTCTLLFTLVHPCSLSLSLVHFSLLRIPETHYCHLFSLLYTLVCSRSLRFTLV